MVDNGINDNIDIDFSQLPLELKQFLAVYPEFKPAIKTQDDVDKFLVVLTKLSVYTPSLKT